ncbi:MAG: NAD-dependent epimerase/dehydratase family protein [Cyclobacteriaceae bacterium]|nr:NAD-dependent epimerase/dehydratase family protein [Cyclobacteriaceae bacterium]
MILVTGGSGVVGAQVIKKLVGQKLAVRATKRSTSDISWTNDINNSIDWVVCDILDLLSLDKAFEGITHVVHCAAIVSFDNSIDSKMHLVNIEGTKNILTFCQKNNVKKLVYISSVAALGRATNATSIAENTKWESSSLNTAYANSKYLAELEVWRAQEEGLSTVILNPSVIIGPGNWSSSSLNLFAHVKKGNPLYPIGSINYVDVRDVANITNHFLFNATQGERFVLNAGLILYKTFFELIAKSLNKKAPSLKISPPLAIFAAYILRIVRFFTGIKFNITKEAVKLSQLSVLFSAKKVEETLNYKFKRVEDSIQWTCKQLKSKSLNP